jgi:uncharacterized glyoxalase superfamily protein PhnB
MTNDQSTGSLNGRGLSASLTVKDLNASKTWYRDVLGFAIAHEYEYDGAVRAVRLAAGDAHLLLNQDDGKKGWERVKGQGVSFQVNLDAGVDDAAKRVQSKGWKFEVELADMPWGQRMFQVFDPDGYKLNVSQPVATK